VANEIFPLECELCGSPLYGGPSGHLDKDKSGCPYYNNWASQDEIDERFRSETAPLVYCEQLQKDRRAMGKLLGLVNAHAYTLARGLRQAAATTDRLFQNKT